MIVTDFQVAVIFMIVSILAAVDVASRVIDILCGQESEGGIISRLYSAERCYEPVC